jgi:integrase
VARVRKRIWRNKDGETSVGWTVDTCDAQGKRQRKQLKAVARRTPSALKSRASCALAPSAGMPIRSLCRKAPTFPRPLRSPHAAARAHDAAQLQDLPRLCPQLHLSRSSWHAEKHADPRHKFQFFDKGLGRKKLNQLTVGSVTQFRDDLRSAGVSVPTRRKILAMLQVMLAYLISLDLLAINVAQDVEVIGRRDEATQQIIPPSKEIMRQLIALADEDFRVKLLFASATGVRASELHALR